MACAAPQHYTEAEREEILAEHEGEERECVALAIQTMNNMRYCTTDLICAWLHNDEAADIYGTVSRPYFITPWGTIHWLAEDAICIDDQSVCAEFIQTPYMTENDLFEVFHDEDFRGAYFSYASDTGDLTFNLMFEEGDPICGEERWFCEVGGIGGQLKNRLMPADIEQWAREYDERHKAS